MTYLALALCGLITGLAISGFLLVLEKKEYIPTRQDLLIILTGLMVVLSLFQVIWLVR